MQTATQRAARLALAGLVLTVAACSEDPIGPEPDVTNCTTTLTAANADTFVELCELTVPARHVRIENLRASATHEFAQIVFGFDAPPASSTGAVAADQFRVLFYGGGVPAPPALTQLTFGSASETLDGSGAFINGGATVCFDLHDGSATTAPAFVLWVSGQRGANCSDRSTLTAATAYGVKADFGGVTGAIDKQANAYFRQSSVSGAAPVITLSGDAVLSADQIAASTTCTTAWSANTDWQQLCSPAGGIVRHVRLEGIQAASNNSYFYAVFGQDPDPTGNPAASAGKLILTGGRSNSGASWTWFRFGTGSTTQFNYTGASSAPLYTDGPSTICFDTGANSNGTARLVFWATGANQADCAVRSTLTLERALYDSSTDEATGSIWAAALVAGKQNFVKTNNANVTIGNVVVSSEAAAL